MLLLEYLLLNLGRLTPGEARRWQGEMAARRRVDAARDLLAFWQPDAADGPARPGQLVAFAVAHPHRFMGEVSLLQFRTNLTEAVREALAAFDLAADAGEGELLLSGRSLAQIRAVREDGVLLGEVYIDMQAARESSGRKLLSAQLATALAYHVEQRFGYAQAALHPVADEEQLRRRIDQ